MVSINILFPFVFQHPLIFFGISCYKSFYLLICYAYRYANLPRSITDCALCSFMSTETLLFGAEAAHGKVEWSASLTLPNQKSTVLCGVHFSHHRWLSWINNIMRIVVSTGNRWDDSNIVISFTNYLCCSLFHSYSISWAFS